MERVLVDVALGRLTKYFSALDLMLRILAEQMIGSPPVGRIVTAGLGTERLEKLVFSLGSFHFADDAGSLTQLREALRKCADARKERNLLIHSIWIEPTATTPLKTLHLKGHSGFVETDMSVEDVLAVCDHINEARELLGQILVTHYVEEA